KPGKAVGRFPFARSKPGKDHGDSTANRLAWGKAAEKAGKEQRRFALFLKIGHVRAVQVNLGGAPVAGRLDLGQLTVAIQKGHAARDVKSFEPVFNPVHIFQSMPEARSQNLKANR